MDIVQHRVHRETKSSEDTHPPPTTNITTNITTPPTETNVVQTPEKFSVLDGDNSQDTATSSPTGQSSQEFDMEIAHSSSSPVFKKHMKSSSTDTKSAELSVDIPDLDHSHAKRSLRSPRSPTETAVSPGKKSVDKSVDKSSSPPQGSIIPPHSDSSKVTAKIETAVTAIVHTEVDSGVGSSLDSNADSLDSVDQAKKLANLVSLQMFSSVLNFL